MEREIRRWDVGNGIEGAIKGGGSLEEVCPGRTGVDGGEEVGRLRTWVTWFKRVDAAFLNFVSIICTLADANVEYIVQDNGKVYPVPSYLNQQRS